MFQNFTFLQTIDRLKNQSFKIKSKLIENLFIKESIDRSNNQSINKSINQSKMFKIYFR